MDLTSIVSMIKGEEGTTVCLSIVRSTEPYSLDLEITRSKLDKETVTHEM